MLEADPTTRRAEQKLDILFVTSDLFPPFRPAAKAVFAEGLAARGHRIDWLLQAAEPSSSSGQQRFKGGVAYVAATNAGASRLARFKRHLANVWNDLRVFGLLRRHRYSLVQIKDKYFGALVAIVAAKLYGVPVFYWLAYPHGEASLYAARNRVARYRWIYRLRGASCALSVCASRSRKFRELGTAVMDSSGTPSHATSRRICSLCTNTCVHAGMITRYSKKRCTAPRSL